MLSLTATQWTTPLTAAQRPFILWCDWADVWPYVPFDTVKISSSGGNVPDILTFTVVDRTNTVGPGLANQQRVLFMDSLAGTGTVLFHGFIKYLRPKLVGPYGRWEVTCADLSELLDYGHPIETLNRPTESDAARIGAVAAFSTWSGMLGGGFVQTLNGAMSPGDFGHATVRTGIEDTLVRTGAAPVGYHVDGYGYLHTYGSADAGAAPFAISDSPNYTTTIPALLEPEFDGSADVDGLFVYGATAAGTGEVNTVNPPRFPARIAPFDAPDSVDAPTLAAVGSSELANRQGITRLFVTVSPDSVHGNFDGWVKGQSLAITNSVLGWVAKSFLILGVDMSFVNGKGARRYRLTVATKPHQKMSFLQQLSGQVKFMKHKRSHVKKIRGHGGAPKNVG